MFYDTFHPKWYAAPGRRNTFVTVAPTLHVMTLAEAKDHLRVDDVTPGAKASVTFGTSNAQLVLTALLDGTYGNSFSAVIVVSGISTTLAVSYAANVFTIRLATNGAGAATSTPNDVIAAIAASPTLSSRISATSGVGLGTSALSAAGSTAFAGGIDGISPHDGYIQLLINAIEDRCQSILRKSLLTQTIKLQTDAFPCARTLELEMGPVQSLVSATYIDANGDPQTLDSSLYEFDINSVPAALNLLPGKYWPTTQCDRRNSVAITYVAGYASADLVPEGIKQAAKLFIGHLFTNREAVQIGAGIVALEVPQTAEWLLWPHRDFRF